jgi:uncharacterized protein YgiM (DUF1202 family)
MMTHRKLLFLSLALMAVLLVSGCDGLFNGGQPEDVEGLVQTQVAQTLEAQQTVEAIVAATLTAMPGVPEEASPTEEISVLLPTENPTPTVVPTEEPAATATVALTPTASITVLEVSVPTNCRVGPGRVFDKVSVLQTRVAAKVVARHGVMDYWVIENPEGGGTCWVWGEYATITGSVANIPIWDSPPLPTVVVGHTPTPAEVTLRVSVPTNCRVGPGRPFEIVSVLQTNKTVRVVARHATADFWVIENPEGAGTCWVWGEYATFTGAKGNLPVQAPPPTSTPQAGQTPAPTDVTLKVRVDTNCRTGPGRPYDIVSILRIGKTAKVVARHGTADFWVIENPDGAGTCWVWGEYATITGSTTGLPVWSSPPTPTPSASAVTLKVSVDTNCRTGPGKPYDIVTIFRIGQTGEVIARNAASTYWVIRNPAGSGHCWVWGKYATLTGSTASLPVWNP